MLMKQTCSNCTHFAPWKGKKRPPGSGLCLLWVRKTGSVSYEHPEVAEKDFCTFGWEARVK